MNSPLNSFPTAFREKRISKICPQSKKLAFLGVPRAQARKAHEMVRLSILIVSSFQGKKLKIGPQTKS